MFDPGLSTGLAAALVFIAIAGTLRAGGASLVRTSRADALKAAAAGTRGAERVVKLLEDRVKLQPALGTTVTFLVVLAVVPLTWFLTDALSRWQLGASLLAMTVVLLLLVDVIPRRIGATRPASVAYKLSLPLTGAVKFGLMAGDLIADFDDDDVMEDEQAADAEERELILSVLEFTDTIVREVMVPRTDMVTIAGSASTDDAVDLVLSSGRSRIPVTGDGVDHVLGVLFSRDLLELFDRELPPKKAEEVCHEPYFVPETKPISELLKEMQVNQQHMAIVVDEFGGTAGIVTIEDLIEEIVGEIADEFDEEEPMVVEVDGGFLVDARLGVDDLASLVGKDLPSDEWDTVGFDHDGLTFTPTEVQGRRVARVRVGRK
jgi:CBS domain containing-hemolysin-like protein